jgi:hypothetical protein
MTVGLILIGAGILLRFAVYLIDLKIRKLPVDGNINQV